MSFRSMHTHFTDASSSPNDRTGGGGGLAHVSKRPSFPQHRDSGVDSHPGSPRALPQTHGAPGSPTDAFHLPRTASSDWLSGGRPGHIHPRSARGMTFEEVQQGGILSADERSAEFVGLELDEKSLGRLPKKLRPYYSHLALLAEHYDEVDALLSGSLPYTVATSFHPSRSDAERAEDAARSHSRLSELDEEDTEGWLRRNSTWRVRKVRRESKNSAASGRTGRGASADRAGTPRSGSVDRDRERERRRKGRAGEEGRDVEEGELGRAEEPDERTGLLSQGKEREARKERIARIALNVNTIVNVLLVLAKVIAVLYSSSISLTASLVDSALDLLSTFIILGTSWAMGIQTDRHKYPAGKRRFEPLGVLIFSVVMIASFVQVFIEAFQRAIKPEGEAAFDLSLVGASTMVATIAIKAVMWVWCSKIPSSGVQALAQDAENDVMLNIISLSFPSMGTFLGWRLLDPIGGMVLSAYIVFEWIKTLFENFENLSGKSASADQVTRVLYLVTRFNPVVEIADVECYHIGDDLIVEVDVILPQGSTLHFAHDVGETIQCCLESLEGVLRAYVHVDYSSANPAQHTSRTPVAPLSNIITPARARKVIAAADEADSTGAMHESADSMPNGSAAPPRGRAGTPKSRPVRLDGIKEGVAK